MLTPDEPVSKNEYDRATPDGWRRWADDIEKIYVPAALATLAELAANAESASVRRSAQRELNRYEARLAKAAKANGKVIT